jgi:thioredoxin 2
MQVMAIIPCPNCGTKNNIDPARAATAIPKCGRCGTPLSISSPAHPVEVTDATFAQTLAGAGEKPVLVDAWATWCPPCRMLAPTIDALAGESAGRWIIAKLDTDQNPQTASRFNISSIPTLLIFKRGQLVDKLVGVQPKQAIAARLTQAAG